MATTTQRKSLTPAQIREGVGAELLSLLDGITSDGKLSEGELAELRAWLQENGEADLPAVNVLETEVFRILEDGVVTPAELNTLHVVIDSVLPVELRRESRERRKLLAAEAKAELKAAAQQAKAAAKEAKLAEQELRDRSRRIDYANFMVAGVHIGNRQAVIERQVSIGDAVYLAREPANRFDQNAIIVQVQNGAVIGYVPRADAAELAPLLDEGAKYAAYVTKVLGYKKAIPVVQTDVYRPDADTNLVGRPLYVSRQMQGQAGNAAHLMASPRMVLTMLGILVVLIGLAMCSGSASS